MNATATPAPYSQARQPPNRQPLTKTETPPGEVEFTILMPCLNEARTVAQCVTKALSFLASGGIRGEVIVADNGSVDGSQALAANAGARVVQVSERGYGAALRAGISEAHGRHVIMGDSDSSYDFSQLSAFVYQLRRGNDLVMGNRFKGGIVKGAMPALHRYLGNPVLSGIGRLFFASAIRDFHCGLRGFRRSSILSLDLKTAGMEFASEMIVKSTLQGLQICEVPTVLHPDGRGRAPHLRSWPDGWRHMRFLLVHAPAWLFMFPGSVLLALGLVGVISIGIVPLRIQDVVLDIHSMLYASAAVTLGFQMVLLAGLSSFHALNLGVLPKLPHGVRWVKAVTLERGLVCGAIVSALGLVLAAAGINLWADSGFSAVDPRAVMRLAIPSCMLLMIGGQCMVAAFMFEILRVHR